MQKKINFYIDKFYLYLKTNKKYSINTINAYLTDIEDFNNFTNKGINIILEDISSYLSHLYNDIKLSKSSISRKLSSLRSFYNYLVKEEIVNYNYFNDVSNPKRGLVLPKFIKEKDMSNIMEVCSGDNPILERDRLILELLYSTGIRVSELINIKLTDINFYNNEIKILGKGSKERIVIFNNTCRETLNKFIKDGRKKLYKNDTGYLFIGRNNGHISSKYVRDIINKVKVKAGVEGKITPHVFRHTFATDMLNNGADLVSVKDLLGHESLNTTSIYTHVTNEQIKKIYEMAHPRAKKE